MRRFSFCLIGTADANRCLVLAAHWTRALNRPTRVPTHNDDICVLKIDHSEQRCLTNGPTDDIAPEVSPNGRWIAFVGKAHGDSQIFIVSWDGSTIRQLTATDKRDFDPAWSPDGSWIAFLSRRSGHVDLYIVHPDGSGLRRLTHSRAAESKPEWAP
jgi:TolB protein